MLAQRNADIVRVEKANVPATSAISTPASNVNPHMSHATRNSRAHMTALADASPAKSVPVIRCLGVNRGTIYFSNTAAPHRTAYVGG